MKINNIHDIYVKYVKSNMEQNLSLILNMMMDKMDTMSKEMKDVRGTEGNKK